MKTTVKKNLDGIAIPNNEFLVLTMNMSLFPFFSATDHSDDYNLCYLAQI